MPTYLNTLIELNRLEHIGPGRWLFYPGMLFGSSQSWWGAGLPRPFVHEGLDLCFFETVTGLRCRLDHLTRVPLIETGRIVAVIDDFIAKTVICECTCDLTRGQAVYVLYAHVLPDDGVVTGAIRDKGEGVARIAPVDPKKSPLPPHLHLSLVLQEALPPPGLFGWRELNRLDRDAFFDPAAVAGLTDSNMHVIDFHPAAKVANVANVYDEFMPITGSRKPLRGSITKTP